LIFKFYILGDLPWKALKILHSCVVGIAFSISKKQMELEMWVNAQRDGRPPNIGGALCSTPQSLADAHY